MEIEYIIQLVQDYGYIGLFFLLWIGVFGLPIPNEVIVMTVGFASTLKILNPILTFFIVFSGIVAAITTLYGLGRFLGRPLFQYLQQKKRFSKVLTRSLRLMDKFHASSLLVGYFLPGIRNLLPFLYGFRKLPFKKFALFAYSGAFLWVSFVYTVGYLFGDNMDSIIAFGKEAAIFIAICIILFVVLFFFFRKRKRQLREQEHPS